MTTKFAIIDLETFAIMPRPQYPPAPVGLAWLVAGKKGYEPCRSPSERQRCAKMVKQWYREGMAPVFHNASFDLDVLETHLGVMWPAAHEDTLLLAYLFEPRAPTFALKPLAERLLGERPDERDALRDWIVAHVKGATMKTWGAYISEAPFELVRPYAIGDVVRTAKLHQLFLRQLKLEPKIQGAYAREKKLTRVLVKMERRGVPVAVRALARDTKLWQAQMGALEGQLFKDLKVPKKERNEEFAWSGVNFAERLLKSGIVDELPLTLKGNPSTSADNLGPLLPPKIAHRLELRAQLQTCISTFALAWLAQAQDGGRFYARYNQVRQNSNGNGGMVGTTTGRLSQSPNLQNVIRSDKSEEVPQLRRYLVPLNGWWWLKRDFCFSDDTEVLTDDGWKLFKDLDKTERIAQWRVGEVSFAKPLAYQMVPYKGDMINIIGQRTTDLLVSPDHKCLQVNEDRGIEFVKAIDYSLVHTQQVHAGALDNGFQILEPMKILVVALQADAKVLFTRDGRPRAIFYLKKQRKIDRLLQAIKKFKLKHTVTYPPSKPGFSCITFMVPALAGLLDFIRNGESSTAIKKFNIAALFATDLSSRQRFVRELQFWDGTKGPCDGWAYTTTVKHNADVIQAVAAVSDIRSTCHETLLPSGKQFYTIGLTDRVNRSWTKCYQKLSVPYDGVIYCVTMPWSTVIVRRNGKVMVTGQSQQEFRIFAHYEGGELLARYKAQPDIDVHVVTGQILKERAGIELARRAMKDVNFGVLYAMGREKMARKLNLDDLTAQRTLAAYHRSLPGIKQLQRQLAACAEAGEPIYTWGGRRYYVEPPKMMNVKRHGVTRLVEQTFEYKLLNLLVQGSAADATKEATVRYDETGWNEDDKGPLLLQVHDELNTMALAAHRQEAMRVLREAMTSIELDVPLLSDGSASRVSWNDVKDVTW